MRKLSKTLAVMSLLTPVGASALGVGEIKLHSALNQQLNAEIPLIVSAGENVSDIRVRLASPEAFEKAGIARHFFLSSIKFEPVFKKDGSVVIRMTSREAVREPFLNFLLQVDWPQGNMFREFTVLVDPPATYQEAFIPVQSAPAAARTPASFGADVLQRRKAQVASSRFKAEEGVYGPTARNDTLWVIAKRVNNDPSVTHEQMMIALFEHNPGAFYKQNVNALMAGKKLRVPGKEVILRLSAREAAQEFQRQNAAWSGKLDTQPRSGASRSRLASTPAEGESQLKLLSPTETAVTEGEIVATESRAASGAQADLAMEMAETVSQENEDLRSRVEELEQQLKVLQSMLTVSDVQLSELQRLAKPVEDRKEIEAATKVLDVDVGKEQVELPREQAATPLTPAAPQPAPIEEKTPPAAASQTEAAVSEEAATDSATNYYGMAFGGVGLVGLLGWWIYRRKREEDYEAESILSALSGYSDEPTNPEQLVVPTIDDAETVSASVSEESSFLSEFTPSDFDAFETDQLEVDPISEADVYLAYGRYKQAEDLIRNSLASHPGRDDCKLKLLEIYYANEDGEAFDKYAEELLAEKKNADEEFWEKVVEMGREICPESALFGGAVNPKDAGSEDADDDISGSLDTESVEKSKAVESDEHKERNDIKADEEDDGVPDGNKALDFDMSSFESPVPTADKVDEGLDADGMQFDFVADLGDDVKQRSDFEFEFNLDEQSGLESGAELGEDKFSDITDMDQVETKLDLAKAYVDMNDEEAARGILGEVMEGGSEEQKKEAKAMMEKLNP
ncbi:MAG: FimV/HubP family polar landmark protein [Pseudomonadota bacterium]